MKKLITIFSVSIVLVCIIVFVIVYLKNNDKYMKAIKYATDNTGDYSKISYYKDNDTVIYYLKYDYADYSKVAIQLEEYIYRLKLLETDESSKFRVDFVGNLDLIEFSFSNYEAGGSVKERFDVAVLGPYGEGYRFFGYYDHSIYSHFTRLEIGKGYDVQNLTYNMCYFSNISVVTCYVNERVFFSEIKEFVNTNWPDCEVINLAENN